MAEDSSPASGAAIIDPDATTTPPMRRPVDSRAATAQFELEEIGSSAALMGLDSSPGTRLQKNAEQREPWLTRLEVCARLGIKPKALYALVHRGKVTIARDGDQLRYRLVRGPGGTGPGPSIRASNNHPSDAYVAALAAFVDELSERLYEAERARTLAQQARDRAIDLVRETSDEHLALSAEHSAVSQQLSGFQQSLSQSQRALERANANQQSIYRRYRQLSEEVEAVAHSPLALPIRRRLLSLVDTPDATAEDSSRTALESV